MKVFIKNNIIADLRWYKTGNLLEVDVSEHPGYYIDKANGKFINIADCISVKELRKKKLKKILK